MGIYDNPSFPILSLLTYIPLIGALFIVFFVKRENAGAIKTVATVVAAIDFILSIPLWLYFDPTKPGIKNFQFIEEWDWIPSLGVKYSFGIDGIALLLVLLTTLTSLIAIYSSYSAINHRQKEYYVLLLLLQTGMLGTFCALDFFLFYVFWEVMLVPMYFIIGIWGGARKLYAAIKFFLYTLAGSVLMLLSILALYFLNDGGIPFLNIKGLGNAATFSVLKYHEIGHLIPPTLQFWIFLGFFFGFAVKVPMFPFHTWLPDAHTEAPTAGSVILAAVLLKMGTYGFVRFSLPILPDQSRDFAYIFIILAIIGIIYGALVAMVQPDVKRLVAYSSVAHMGFVILGMFSFTEWGMQGALYQMLNHGVSTGALFLFVGMIYERRHTRMISEFGGLARPMPWFSALFVIASLSSIGLPFLNGFIGEFLIMLGAWTSAAVNHAWIVTMLAGTGVIWAAVYMLWMLQRVVFGTKTSEANARLSDLDAREVGLLLPLLALIFFMGVYPQPFLSRSRASIEAARQRMAAPQSGGSFEIADTVKQPKSR